MDVTMVQAADNNLRLVIDYVTGAGDLADIDGPHTVQSSNPTIASVLSQADGPDQHHVVIYELHPVAGHAVLSGSADADLGAGTRMLSWSFDLNVLAEEAVGVQVSMGELIPK